eukprot:scaffold5.g865.t1
MSAALVSPAYAVWRGARAPRPAPAAVAAFAGAPGGRRRALSARPAAAAHEGDSASWYQPCAASTDEFLALLRERRPGVAAPQQPGVVHLVGTGPGDPGLLTLRAVQLMQSADVVLYDRLVSEDILRLVGPSALMVYVGKQRSFHTRRRAAACRQEEIHELLCHFAREGASVVRLKGGDPFIFGRGGEETEYLQARSVRVNVVPGITAAAGVAAELGLPLTHRGLATSVRYLTGHSRAGGEETAGGTVAAAAVDPATTLVVYMGLATLPALAEQLAAGGLPADTPAVAVERGTTPEQRCVYAPLRELSAAVAEARLASPTLVVIGPVVSVAPGWRRFRATGARLQEGRGGGAEDGGAGRGARVAPEELRGEALERALAAATRL